MSGMDEKGLVARITEYLSLGGLFNPEMANHDAVRDLLIDCRDALAETPATPEEPAALVERFKEFLGYFDAIETLPRVAELYYAVKNEGSGTGWRYVATGFGPSDIRDAAIALCIATLRAAEQSASQEGSEPS